MKKLIFIVVFCLTFFTMQAQNELTIEVYRDKDQTFSLPKVKSEFGFVALFYERIAFNFDLLNKIDSQKLQESCKFILTSLKQGKKAQLLVKNYDDGKDLYFNFGQFQKDETSILVTSNYDAVTKKLLQKGDDLRNSFALLYQVVDGLVVKSNAPKEAEKSDNKLHYANNLLFDKNKKNDSAIKKLLEEEIAENKTPAAYIVLSQFYFSSKNVKWGLKFLEENKSAITKDENLSKIYEYTYAEGQALAFISGR
ncbi:MAG: hypothetical protein IKI31_02470 [Treponema sp.]|nr:hypothetical protein [Treponema sp.]